MSIFNKVSLRRPKRTAFDLSHERKMSMNMGQLVPIMCQDIVPGDTFNVSSEIMLRFAPMISPIMHRVNVFTHYFFVPNRLIWNQWEEFITGGPDGQSSPVFPTFDYDTAKQYIREGSLGDYLGYPVQDLNSTAPIGQWQVSMLPFRAYALIWNEFYRDQNLQDPLNFSLNSGIHGSAHVRDIPLMNRCWEKDYLTSALPWTQRGGDVTLPLTGDAGVYFDPSGIDLADPPRFDLTSGIGAEPPLELPSNFPGLADNTGRGTAYNPKGSLKADMSDVTAVTINQLRQSNALQRWLERNARGGSRYVEQIFSHFGVKSSDARLQRPEYLGGGMQPVVVSEVLQTSSTDNISPQANMSGHGISVGRSNRFKRFFEEHGILIGIMSVLPRTAYNNPMPRYFTKTDKFDFYFPEFAHLGEQPVYNFEVDATTRDSTYLQGVFGYQSRYAEYKYIPSSVHGTFKSSLDFWHMARKFDPSSPPLLNEDFVSADPTKRIFAVTDEKAEQLWVQVYNNVKAIRPMPKFGTPML